MNTNYLILFNHLKKYLISNLEKLVCLDKKSCGLLKMVFLALFGIILTYGWLWLVIFVLSLFGIKEVMASIFFFASGSVGFLALSGCFEIAFTENSVSAVRCMLRSFVSLLLCFVCFIFIVLELQHSGTIPSETDLYSTYCLLGFFPFLCFAVADFLTGPIKLERK